MITRTSTAQWLGTIKEGKGTMKVGRAWEGSYSFPSRFEDGAGTNPEELLGAAHAGCFSMALSGALGRNGFTPNRISTTAKVSVDKLEAGFRITRIVLATECEVPGIDDAKFQEIAEGAKKGCPVSVALAGTTIELDARLVQSSAAMPTA